MRGGSRSLQNDCSRRWASRCPTRLSFPSERVERTFQKALEKIPTDYQVAVVQAIRSLASHPRPQGKRTKKLSGHVIVSQFTAEYRLCVGPYRILYDIDDKRKRVILLKLLKAR
jgi:mRNA-degrading endonuclease RelE of RelBE toxin-antitoxin system